jgi:hypothetical protein
MATEYSGLIGLAQTVLAINMAYIALDRFRYGAQIQKKVQSAKDQIEGMPREYLGDLAWQNVQSIAAGDSPDSWTKGRLGYKLSWLIDKFTDVAAAYVFAASAAVVIIWQACANAMDRPGALFTQEFILDWAVVGLLIAGVVNPVFWTLAGRYAVRCAERSIEANMSHLTGRVHQEASADVTKNLGNLRE